MPDLIDKLNLLLRSSMNDFLSNAPARPARITPPTPEELDAELSAPAGEPAKPARIPVERLGKDIDREIAELRKHIDSALADEDNMRDKLDRMQAQIENFDRKADEALQEGDQDKARDYIKQMGRQKQLAEQLQLDLKRHGAATSELIERVNTLESVVSDARRQEQAQAASPAAEPASQTPGDTLSSAGVALSSFLRDARERVEAAINTAPAEPTKQEAPPAEASTGDKGVNVPIKVVTDPDVEADLARRRSRLSKPE